MVRQKAKDTKKQVEEQNKRFYGEEEVTGSMPDPESDDSVADIGEKLLGKDSSDDFEKGKPLNLAKEIDKDDKNRRTKPLSSSD